MKKNVITLTFYNQFWIKNCIRIISTRSVVLDRSQSVLIGKMKKCVFPKKQSIVFRDTFSSELFNFSALHTGGGARPRGRAREAGAPAMRACPRSGHACEAGMPQKISEKHQFYNKNTYLLRKILFGVGVHPFRVHTFRVHPFGVHPFGVHPFEVHPFGCTPSGRTPSGRAPGAGPPLPCVERKY